MPTQLVLDVQSNITQAKTGLKTVASGIQDVEDAAVSSNKATGGMASGLEMISKRTERPLGRFLFRDLAMSAYGATGAMTGMGQAGMATQVAMDVAARSALLFTGGLGFLVLAGAATVAILASIAAGSKESTAAFKTSVETSAQNSVAYAEAAKNAKALGVIDTETFNQLMSNSKEQRSAALDKIRDQQQQIKNSREAAQAALDEAKSQTAMQQASLKNMSFRNEEEKQMVAAAQQQSIQNTLDGKRLSTLASQEQALQKLLAAETALKTLRGNSNEQISAEDRASQMRAVQVEFMERYLGDAKDMVAVNYFLKDSQAQVNLSEYDYIDALDKGDKAAIDSAKRRLDALKSEAAAWTSTKDKILADERQKAAVISQINNTIASGFEAVNGKILFNSRKVIAGELRSFSDAEAKKMELKAISAFPNVALAATYAGLGLAIRLAGSAAAAAVEAGGQTSSGTTAGATSATTSAGSSAAPATGSLATNPQNMNLQIVIQGNLIGNDKWVQEELIPQITSAVNNRDAFLVSSTVKPDYGIAT